jgi:hypothetical protein
VRQPFPARVVLKLFVRIDCPTAGSTFSAKVDISGAERMSHLAAGVLDAQPQAVGGGVAGTVYLVHEDEFIVPAGYLGGSDTYNATIVRFSGAVTDAVVKATDTRMIAEVYPL